MFYDLVHSHKFWNEIVFVCITEKYMEFDLNDKGEIGKTTLVTYIFSNSEQLLLSVVTHNKDVFTDYRYEHR